jgi:hypothetical protein
LVLEDAQLIAEKEDFRPEASLGAAAYEQEIENDADEEVEESQEHDPASSKVDRSPSSAADRTPRRAQV